MANPNHSLFFVNQYWKRLIHNSFFNTVEKNPLTKKQRQAIILDEARNLIVAGAGTGKTSTVIGKIGYLLRTKRALPEEILVIAYNSNAAQELRDRAAELVDASVEVGTFHAIGKSILEKANVPAKVASFINQNVKLKQFVATQLGECLKDEKLLSLYTEFFINFDAPTVNEHEEFKTISSYAKWLSQNLQTLDGTKVKSYGELLIANFLFIHGIEYEYEKEYFRTIEVKSGKFYKPDFYLPNQKCFIEYFGIDENKNTAPFIDKEDYNDKIAWKLKTHKYYNTDLISLYYYQNRVGNLSSCLEGALLQRNVKLEKKSDKEIFKKIVETGKHEKFIDLLIRFLTQFKENQRNLTLSELKNKASNDKRSLLFLTLFESILKRYQLSLERNGEIDFGDMIDTASDLVRDHRFKVNWKYVIIDEFQDISRGRYNLIKAILDQSASSKLYCVGDDWQAIYRFAGSDHQIMNNFRSIFGNATSLKLDKTFRFNNQIAEVSRKFITKNPSQIKKRLKALTIKKEPQVILNWIDENNLLSSLTKTIGMIKSTHSTTDKSLQILARYNNSKISEDFIRQLEELWEGKILVQRTIHAAKGLEADFVIVLDLNSIGNGFPSSKNDDPILNLILSEQDNFQYSEERRLFYVALTRAKEQTYLIADNSHPSEFALELETSGYNVKIVGKKESDNKCPACTDGKIIEKTYDNSIFFSCANYPVCKYKAALCSACKSDYIVRRHNDAGQEYSVCRNEDCKAEHEFCDRCADGILIEKPSPYGPFLSCHNYGFTGCLNKKDLNLDENQKVSS